MTTEPAAPAAEPLEEAPIGGTPAGRAANAALRCFSKAARAFTLYDSLHRANLDFGFEAQAVVDNGAGTGMETICTRLYWQLLDEKPAKQQYYAALFRDLRQIIERLPSKPTDYRGLLAGVLGRGRLPAGLIIVKRQMKRFTAR